MSKSDDEKAALESQGGLGTLAGGTGGVSIPSDFMDRMTTTIKPIELSSMPSNIREAYSDAARVEAVGKMPSMSDRFGPGGMTTLTGGNFVGSDFGSLGLGMGDIGNFDPTGGLEASLPQFQPEKTFGQKAKDTVVGFLKRLARVHPATRNAAFAVDFVKGLQNSKNPQEFVKGVLGNLAMRKVGSNVGISPMAMTGLKTAGNIQQGRMTPGQGIASLGTSAAFRAAGPSIFKSAYDKGGMNAVYGVATLLGMAQNAAQQKIMQPGPGGDG